MKCVAPDLEFLWFLCVHEDAVTGTAIVLSAIPAIIGIYFSARSQRSLQRKTHTLDVLLRNQPEVRRALGSVAAYISAGEGPEKKTGHADIDNAILATLDHFEYISAGIARGDIDEALVRTSEKTTFLYVFRTFQKYVYNTRNVYGTRTTFENLEIIYLRWCLFPRRGILQLTCELLSNQPSSQWTRVKAFVSLGKTTDNDFSEIYDAAWKDGELKSIRQPRNPLVWMEFVATAMLGIFAWVTLNL